MILHDNKVQENSNFTELQLTEGLSIYEVIRIFHGKPIFLKDNLLRLQNSLDKSNLPIQVNNLQLSEKINKLITLEHIQEGNVKYILHFTSGKEAPDEYLFQIPHAYPTAADYEQGIETVTFSIVRENPEIKYLNPVLREATNKIIQEKGVYEVLLVDKENYITEGSRSNVFFIREETLYTAPVQYVLPGTSRKRVFDICKKENIRICEERVALETLSQFKAAFITGTSPLLLPIHRINDVIFDTHNPLLKRLMKSYFALLENVI